MITHYDPADPTVTSGERTYQAILQKILKGEFPAGTRLTRRPLAEMLGVSHIPVLEAMKRLEQDGLIEYHPHWGSIVTIPTPAKVKDMFLLREAVECQVARQIAAEAGADTILRLEGLAADLDRLPFENSDALVYTDRHYNFHMSMAEATGSIAIVTTLRRNNFLWLLCLQGQSRRPRAPESFNRHKHLVEVLREGDPQKAEEAMREHIRFGYLGLMQDIVFPAGGENATD